MPNLKIALQILFDLLVYCLARIFCWVVEQVAVGMDLVSLHD